ncbi:MAG: hypothetical protein UW43_C0003G0023 [Candidatus Yanofskybacteria bacterium GW2011_GWA1_44_21]|uniref:Peptidase M50 domain-containing protein n=2 Tax=Candidatus Yanofskyibacteriota TaxID=1752733 RepID=A0A1F8H135_9BACT|nr:MAG: hypothetical protein UW14_C0008G0014 [Candidatus Yanofskybacteria bacterium GW2011_GWA2_44_10]KKT50681.1 MAG: hypothetical protein UW43_C0003G0023 [Candidatus Yanofskybacteria bacterium GW2011_GWA1_44_21]KKT90209.1 MAG: hypothetical protein UW90_C0004G0014 [Candidatus Yanofskybacteria bacterium GW2011_GWB1_45_11]OGN02227.1 MAG: hypothetical protein A2657_02620 [Candidatus Yanofskybacteria bacterium RIFCSPHIGHO2_01_FULL_44_110b]OGN14854.1 MAG: hypothetical protein A3C01_02515 [Candidatus
MLDIFKIVVFILSVVIHEVSHGVMANSLGDSTAKDLGRITLNPFKHIDIFGSVILPLMLLLTNVGFIFGYAKPVPYNPANLRDKKYGPAKVAFAGPASNIILAIVFGILLRFMPDIFASPLIPQLFLYIVWINLALAIFNLFPIPPLDGHWLLMAILPDRLQAVKIFLYRYSIVLFLALLFFIGPILSAIVFSLMSLLTGIRL